MGKSAQKDRSWNQTRNLHLLAVRLILTLADSQSTAGSQPKLLATKLMPMNHKNVANVNTFGIKCLIMDLL